LNPNLVSNLISPYGGKLVDLLVSHEESAELRSYASSLPSIQLSERAVCDLELLANGGFSPLDRKEDRDANIRRLGFVAMQVVRHGGIAICAAISPYHATRNEVRSMIGEEHFIEVFVDTPLDVCERRDAKGMYLKARRGELKGFTGIDDPYESPAHPNITLDTISHTAAANAQTILEYLIQRGFVRSDELSQ
jgi:adenylyl-sulfate kinase